MHSLIVFGQCSCIFHSLLYAQWYIDHIHYCVIIARTLSYWCFSAGYAMSGIALQVKSIILTSGTLRPLDSFAAELKVYVFIVVCLSVCLSLCVHSFVLIVYVQSVCFYCGLSVRLSVSVCAQFCIDCLCNPLGDSLWHWKIPMLWAVSRYGWAWLYQDQTTSD